MFSAPGFSSCSLCVFIYTTSLFLLGKQLSEQLSASRAGMEDWRGQSDWGTWAEHGARPGLDLIWAWNLVLGWTCSMALSGQMSGSLDLRVPEKAPCLFLSGSA